MKIECPTIRLLLLVAVWTWISWLGERTSETLRKETFRASIPLSLSLPLASVVFLVTRSWRAVPYGRLSECWWIKHRPKYAARAATGEEERRLPWGTLVASPSPRESSYDDEPVEQGLHVRDEAVENPLVAGGHLAAPEIRLLLETALRRLCSASGTWCVSFDPFAPCWNVTKEFAARNRQHWKSVGVFTFRTRKLLR